MTISAISYSKMRTSEDICAIVVSSRAGTSSFVGSGDKSGLCSILILSQCYISQGSTSQYTSTTLLVKICPWIAFNNGQVLAIDVDNRSPR